MEEADLYSMEGLLQILLDLPSLLHHVSSKRLKIDGSYAELDNDQQIGQVKSHVQTIESIVDKLKSDLTEMEAAYAKGPAEFENWRQQSEKRIKEVLDTWMKPPSRGESPSQEEPNQGESTRRLSQSEYQKYGRQMIMPEIGLEGQLKLKKAKVLIVGLGGLGCPAAAYLAGAGVGVLGLVDDDTVSHSNLHRQILYVEGGVGLSKVGRATHILRHMNSSIHYEGYGYRLTPEKAVDLFRDYDLILDCTDHPTSRYFISDAAVLTGKPLIHASALRTEGQLMVLNNPPSREGNNDEGYCYRCVYPKPSPPASVVTCGEGGILGPVVGVMGTLMAMEAIKILVPTTQQADAQVSSPDDHQPRLITYSAYSSPSFRAHRLKGKRKDCVACSGAATITRESLEFGSLDYVAFCGGRVTYDVLKDNQRMSARQCKDLFEHGKDQHALVDVREKVQFDIGHIDGSINIPFSDISRDTDASMNRLVNILGSDETMRSGTTLHFICRYGNDSQLALRKILELPRCRAHKDMAKYALCHRDYLYIIGRDIIGGLDAWRKEVDEDLPDY